jgi:hypothetical protein
VWPVAGGKLFRYSLLAICQFAEDKRQAKYEWHANKMGQQVIGAKHVAAQVAIDEDRELRSQQQPDSDLKAE